MNPVPVLIVGAGPVGLTMATHLHHHGIQCRIVDKNPVPTDKSKALALWARSLEMLDNVGITQPFIDAGQLLNSARLHAGTKLLTTITFDPQGTRHPKPLMIPQCDTERLLAEHLQRQGICIERGVELLDLTDHGDHVSAILHHPDGHDESVNFDWLVGCDGAHSLVRKKIGMEFTGEAEPNDWVLADCRVEGVSTDDLSAFWHTKGVVVFFPFGQGRCRLIADMGLAKNQGRPADPTLAEVQAIAHERGLTNVKLSDPHWLAGFRIHERKVAEYRHGRVFLAGDAAHIHSPAGGQGMNTGMQDAFNLAWKLALVQSGRAKPSLLDSYGRERSEVGDLVLKQAGRMTRMVTLRNPILRFIRNRVVGIVTRIPSIRRNMVRYLSELSIHYPHSPLNGESGGWSKGGICPGDRIPDIELRSTPTGEQEWLQHAVRGPKYNLLLIANDVDSPTLQSLNELQQQLHATYLDRVNVHLILPTTATDDRFASVLIDPTQQIRKSFGARGNALALVRPDGYLAYRCQPATWTALREYLDRYWIA